MNTVKITKMQGLGNDFVILDYEEYEKTGMQMSELAKKICDRHFGVGADGMIIPNLLPSDKTADIGWFFYNSDGTTAQMCGNGIRCFAKYVYDKKMVSTKTIRIETLAGIIIPEIQESSLVRVNMSKPVLSSVEIPCAYSEKKVLDFPLEISSRKFRINVVSMGNPHCVIFIDNDEDLLELAKKYGPEIEKNELFPQKTNVEFVKVISKNEIDMRVWERGCGITLACGTGACASVVAGILNNLTENKVKVNLLGGALIIEWQGSSQNIDDNVFMRGPAEYSFFAEFIL